MPAALELLHSRYPAICIHIRQAASAHERTRELRERNFDLAIGGIVKPIDDDIDAQILFYDPTFVVAGLKSRWSQRRKIRLAELADEPWILPPSDSVLGSRIVEAFRGNELDVPAANVVTLAFQLYGPLCASGPYLAICPGSVLHFSATRLALKALPVDLGISPWPIGITTLKNRTISPVDSSSLTARATPPNRLRRLEGTKNDHRSLDRSFLFSAQSCRHAPVRKVVNYLRYDGRAWPSI